MPSYIAPVRLTRGHAVRPAEGLRFGNFDGAAYLPPVKSQARLGPHSISALNNQQIYRTICDWVEAWQPWQQKIILYSIINRCTVQQLEILATTLEPLRHRDFMTVSHKHYSSASLRAVASSKESTLVLKSALKKLPKIASGSDKSLRTDCSARQNGNIGKPSSGKKSSKQDTPDNQNASNTVVKDDGDNAGDSGKMAEKGSAAVTLDQYASLVSSALLVAAIGEIALADKIERKMLTDIQERADENDVPQKPSAVTLNVQENAGSKDAVAEQDPVPVDGNSAAPERVNSSTVVREASNLPGILRSANLNREKSREEGQMLAQFLGGQISFTPQSRQSRCSEPLCSGSSRYRRSAFTSSAASTTDFFVREKISVLGPMQREIRVGQVQRPLGLGDIPVPMQRMYKNRGWWPDVPPQGMKFQLAKKQELSNNFRDQQATILGWLHEWESYERMALLKEIAKVCGPTVLEALVAYIRQKLQDACDINRLPDKLLLYILSFLSPANIMTCAQVCRRWRYLCAMDNLWIVKCLELGEEEGIENVPQLIEEANKQQMGVDWMLAYMELHGLVTNISQAQERAARQAEEERTIRETERHSRTTGDESSLMKRFRIRRRSQLVGAGASFQPDVQLEVEGQPKDMADGKGEQTMVEDSEVDSAFSEEDLTPFMRDGDMSQPQPKPSRKFPSWGRTQRKTLRSSVQHKIQETVSERSSPARPSGATGTRGSSKAGDSRQKSSVKEDQDEEMALDIHTDLTQSKDLLGKVVPAMSLEWETPEHNEDFVRYPVYAGKVYTIQRVRKVQGHIGGILCLQFDQRRLFTGGADHAVRMWDVRSGRSVHKFYGHKGGVRCLKFDGEILVTGSWDSIVMVWDIRRFSREAILHGHDNSVSCLHLSRHFVISGSHDCTVRVWSRPTYTCTQVLCGHAGPVLSLVADDDYVFSTSTDLTVRVTDLLTGQCVRVLERANKSNILTLTMHGALLLGGDAEGRVYFWNTRTGEAEAAVQVHDATINTVAYHNGRFYTGSSDGTMTEYDLMTMTCLRVLRGHKGPVRALQVSDRRFVSCSDDGTVRIWDLCTGKTTSLSSVF